MTYPIDAQYDKHDGLFHLGFAATAEEAQAVFDELDWDDDMPTAGLTVRLTESQVGGTFRTKAEAEAAWGDEIAAGWARVGNAWGGYIVTIETWVMD